MLIYKAIRILSNSYVYIWSKLVNQGWFYEYYNCES